METGVLMASLSTAIAFLAVLISLYTYHRTTRSSVRPVLIFSMTTDFLWRVENVGAGPAINVVVAHRQGNAPFVDVTNCYPIAAGSSLDLKWIGVVGCPAAVYTDVFGSAFTTTCSGTTNRVESRNAYKDWKPERDQWLQLLFAEGRFESNLTEEDLVGLTPTELEIRRCEIYARRGYIFKRPDLADYFSRQPWYTPKIRMQAAAYRQLTPAERYEAHLILDVQKRHGLRADPIIPTDLRNTLIDPETKGALHSEAIPDAEGQTSCTSQSSMG